MQASSALPSQNRTQWLGVTVTVIAVVVSGVLLILYADAALSWTQTPFAGFLPSRNLDVDIYTSLADDEEWPALQMGLETGDRVTGVDDVMLSDLVAEDRPGEMVEIFSQHNVGDRVTLSFQRETESEEDLPPGASCMAVPDTINLYECDVSIRLAEVSDSDVIGYFWIGWGIGAILWVVATLLALRRIRTGIVQLMVVGMATLAIFLAGAFDVHSTHRFTEAWIIAGCMVGSLLVVFALEFPYRFAAVQRTPALLLAPVVVGLALSGLGIAFYYSTERELNLLASDVARGTVLFGLVVQLVVMLWRRQRSSSPLVRNQTTMAVLGVVPWLVLATITFSWELVTGEPLLSLWVFNQALPLLFAMSVVYSGLQVRLVDTDRVITQSILYTLMLAVLTLAYWLVVGGLGILLGRSTRDTALSPLLITFSILAIAVLFTPLRQFLQRLIDAIYFRTRRAYQQSLEAFSREVTNAVTLADVISQVQRYLADTLAPTHVILFVRDIVTYEYRAQHDPETDQRPTDIVFAPDTGLIRYLSDRASLIYLEEGRPLPLDIVSDRSRLAVLGAPVIVRPRGQRRLNGFLVIGPRKGGGAYLHEDLRFIESLSDQIAVAVERAQAVDDLERRMRVQDVLSQVSRALNFAIDFDVLLELVYAQTTRVIDAPNFYIALRDLNVEEMHYVFYNEGDERIESMEGRRWRMGRDLISEIARSRQTIRTDDYVRESLMRDPNANLINPNLKAWMGVPLLADTGGGVLGVMVAATTEPGVTFTDDQQDLFWDIANLASSAIDKLQLFDKTEQRARQLSAINEISSRLASEMGNLNRLLQLITENAVEILGTEAGSLLLVDEESQDLEFRVVVGGGGRDLIGTRIAAGSGVVGATAQRGQSIIVNDPARDSRWIGNVAPADEVEPVTIAGDNGFEGSRADGGIVDGGSSDDGSSEGGDAGGFQTNALLSVPLMAQNRAIGVLQMVNKRDGSIFVQEDADLLETFAGQAAIAIENARLFDMTDQQLALRVQELDTMQRIDQELNRTLNLENVLEITMDWALRKSGASAGALFIMDREINMLRIASSYGYPETSPFSNLGLTYPAERGVVGRVVRSGQHSLFTDVTMDPDYEETFPGCVAQLAVPLLSANQVIGVIILESDQEGELGLLDLDFVSRLVEHASPAIVNAQLFQELQRANEAKSEFVSFVAHELRNPMTSMKGFTDLLLKGVVGPVNEQQGDFLNTIFNNVTRMETLVSDLNDLTKQQTDNLRLELAPVDFRNVIIETLRAQQPQIEEKNQELRLEVPEDLPAVMGDQNRLIQIMTNFISNAYKYTPPNGTVTIHAEHTRNNWDPQGPPAVIHCFVRDTGIGMSEEDLGQLFTPYFRSENPKTREQPGTGLGLTITKGLIEQHGGQIWVESTVDVGTTFHFTIPVATEQELAAAQQAL
ncbi:MAG: GAF domain-containing protein [Chloroflexi bacterium]|nr:GAF domain-containing protein [Chloroflexota bacterium]